MAPPARQQPPIRIPGVDQIAVLIRALLDVPGATARELAALLETRFGRVLGVSVFYDYLAMARVYVGKIRKAENENLADETLALFRNHLRAAELTGDFRLAHRINRDRATLLGTLDSGVGDLTQKEIDSLRLVDADMHEWNPDEEHDEDGEGQGQGQAEGDHT